jgi:hypothetical protein
MGQQHIGTLRLLTEDERKNARWPCGEDQNAPSISYKPDRCQNPVMWLWTNNGGHTQLGSSTLQEIYWCDECAPK